MSASSKVVPAAVAHASPDEGTEGTIVFDADEPELEMLRAELERLERVASASTRGVILRGAHTTASVDSLKYTFSPPS